jgi:uncharacterized protein (DUF1501 family)
MNRREFLKALGTAPAVVKLGGGISLLSGSAFASEESFTDYKAIVVLNLGGGNDAMNMFIPAETSAHATYSSIRGDLAISETDLFQNEFYKVDSSGYFSSNGGEEQPYYAIDPDDESDDANRKVQYQKGSYHIGSGTSKLGINGLMPELASLYKKGVLSVVSNVGTLVKPTTKAEIENGTAELPLFLFAHNHQERAVATTQADVLGKSGWAGRIADVWKVNGDIGLNISFFKSQLMMIGRETNHLSMKPTKLTSYSGIGFSSELSTFSETLNYEDNNFKRVYNSLNISTANLSSTLETAWSEAKDFSTFSAKNPYGEDLFTVSDFEKTLGMKTHHGLRDELIEQFEAVAKMIDLSKNNLGHKRQIFYINSNNYDSHSNQIEAHSRNLRSISLGLNDFYKAIEEIGQQEEVLVILTSEFGRTLATNGDGTDHGWGGHSFMLCGDPAFNGGQIFGEVMSDLSLDGVNAYTKKSRIIPTTSIEQMFAPVLDWFGVDETVMKIALPNLENFQTDETYRSAFLSGVLNIFTKTSNK